MPSNIPSRCSSSLNKTISPTLIYGNLICLYLSFLKTLFMVCGKLSPSSEMAFKAVVSSDQSNPFGIALSSVTA